MDRLGSHTQNRYYLKPLVVPSCDFYRHSYCFQIFRTFFLPMPLAPGIKFGFSFACSTTKYGGILLKLKLGQNQLLKFLCRRQFPFLSVTMWSLVLLSCSFHSFHLAHYPHHSLRSNSIANRGIPVTAEWGILVQTQQLVLLKALAWLRERAR